jgi:hypothetical protein
MIWGRSPINEHLYKAAIAYEPNPFRFQSYHTSVKKGLPKILRILAFVDGMTPLILISHANYQRPRHFESATASENVLAILLLSDTTSHALSGVKN